MQNVHNNFLSCVVALFLLLSPEIFAQQKLNIQNEQDGGNSRGIFMWNTTNSNWGIYMGSSGQGKSLSNGTATPGAGFGSHAIRFRTYSDANGVIFENSNEKLLFSVRAYDGMGFFSGDVGIGTTNPGAKLEVNGQLKITGGSPGAGKVLVSDANGLASWQANPVSAVSFRDGAYIGGDKTVASIPQKLRAKYSLFVEKGVLAEDYAIAPVANWADYVFAKTYKLRSLSEVEKFIKTWKHLPDVPSEKEINEIGYSTHSMNTKLLAKIEELTLYTIDLQKQLIAQQKQLNKLKKRQVSK